MRDNWWRIYREQNSRLCPLDLPLLHIACCVGIATWVRIIFNSERWLKLWWRPNKRDSEGREALWYAAFRGHEAVVRLLLDRGASPSAKNKDGMTALHWAAIGRHEAVVKLLLDRGADTNAEDKDGRMALHMAAFQGHEAVVRLLLDRGADVNAKDKDGKTALLRAAVEGREAVERLLRGCQCQGSKRGVRAADRD